MAKRKHNNDKVQQEPEFVTLEELGLEETNPTDNQFKSGILTYLEWFYDGELPDYSD